MLAQGEQDALSCRVLPPPLIPLPTHHLVRFRPIYQERVWGGRKLESLYGRVLPQADQRYGESWEICDRVEAQTAVYGGPLDGLTLHELWTKFRVEIFGETSQTHPCERFPLLIKILDCQEDLSIQVHPNDGNAAAVKGEAKSEAWYVADCQLAARLYAGLKPGTTRESLELSMAAGTVAEQAEELQVQIGDCVAIPGGTMHALCGGLVIFEVQQNSDTTYRVFDWNRTGLDGEPRALHQEQALQVLDFDSPPPEVQRAAGDVLLDWPHFRLERWKMGKFEGRQAGECGTFLIGAVAQGQIECAGATCGEGDFFLIPACLNEESRLVKAVTPTALVLWITL
jgi:mannose-6-phosphate isomerase